MNQASAPWLSRLRGCCSEHVVRERKVLRALFLIAFLSSVFYPAFASVYCRPALGEGRVEREISWRFPSPLPSSLPRMWKKAFEDGIHHLMRSFHPSIINIVWGSIFFTPWKKKNSENFLDLYSRLRPTPSKGRSLRYVLWYEANRAESMAVGDFGALWRSCIGPPSQPKLAYSLPNKRLSY